jgi:PAS domain S-box-containing protein
VTLPGARRLQTIPPWETANGDSARGLGDDLFRLFMETIPAGAFVWDGLKPVYVNEMAQQISGYCREELMTMSPWDLVHPDSLPDALEQYRKNLAGEEIPQQYELKMVTKSGEARWVDLRFDWLHLTDTDSLMIGIATDITERKVAGDALRESEARFRILYQDNPAMYFTVDASGRVLDVNEFGAAQLGYTPDELVDTQVVDVFDPEDRDAVSQQLRNVLARPGETCVWEFKKVRKDGTVIWVKEVAKATQDLYGSPIVLIVCEDISEWKRIEDALRHAREEVERKVERKMNGKGAYGLTFRELTVLHLVAGGKPDKEIATVLGISPLTASKHVTNILAKMRASSRAEASARAVRERLLD